LFPLPAEKAHALYNGTTFDDGSRLHLYFTDDDQEPEPSATVLQVKNIASEVSSNDIYCLFRTFGPIGYCTVVSDEPNVDIRDSALVQFYEQEDADVAVSELVWQASYPYQYTLHVFANHISFNLPQKKS
jgi:RNA recognition motif-containing protein